MGLYALICLFFFVFQRSFIYIPTPAHPTHNALDVLELLDARLRLSTRQFDGPQAMIYFGGNAEDVASTVPELATVFPDHATLRKQIRAAAVDQAQVTDASLLIVLTADLKAWKKSPERYWRNATPVVWKPRGVRPSR